MESFFIYFHFMVCLSCRWEVGERRMTVLVWGHTQCTLNMNVRYTEGSFASYESVPELHDCGSLDESWHLKPCLCHQCMWVEIAWKHSSPIEIQIRVK